MTNEELDRLWFEAMHQSIEANENFVRYRFAALVAAAEREECAKVCDRMAEEYAFEPFQPDPLDFSDAIRARGET
jgi:hypothetical protein